MIHIMHRRKARSFLRLKLNWTLFLQQQREN